MLPWVQRGLGRGVALAVEPTLIFRVNNTDPIALCTWNIRIIIPVVTAVAACRFNATEVEQGGTGRVAVDVSLVLTVEKYE